jgi:hypothetical protein
MQFQSVELARIVYFTTERVTEQTFNADWHSSQTIRTALPFNPLKQPPKQTNKRMARSCSLSHRLPPFKVI